MQAHAFAQEAAEPASWTAVASQTRQITRGCSGGGQMSDNLDHDVRVLREWLRRARQFLADPSSTRFERREIRNSMREAEVAVRTGSKAFPTVRRHYEVPSGLQFQVGDLIFVSSKSTLERAAIWSVR
jgi:hypothetical protein